MADKKNVTLSIDAEVHKDFKVECVLNNADMSLNVEDFMKRYVEVSRKSRLSKEVNHETR